MPAAIGAITPPSSSAAFSWMVDIDVSWLKAAARVVPGLS
jgi:hypothetical protein